MRPAARCTVLIIVMCLSATAAFASSATAERSGPVNLTSPSPTPTISDQALYDLGVQSGELRGMNSRLDKIETKLDGLESSVTRINTIGMLVGILFAVFFGPLAVEKWKQTLGKSASG